MSEAVAIIPTKHALERFRERVLPLLPESKRVECRADDQMLNLLKRADITTDEVRKARSGCVKVDVIFSLDELPPIPLTLVINPEDGVLVTLYTPSGWKFKPHSNRMMMSWSA